jgi:L-serine dehydratase
MKCNDAASMLKICESEKISISEYMIRFEMDSSERPREEIIGQMTAIWEVMKSSSHRAFEDPDRISLKITNNDALLLYSAIQDQKIYLSELVAHGMCYALSVSALNASMGRVAACPTGGSCGVVPGSLEALRQVKGVRENVIIRSLFTASAVGAVISEKATLAGAVGGCQAEVGTATAMAAAAVCDCLGADSWVCFEAASIALKSLMGLVCDPVASLVESPCTKRNANGVAIAYASAEMALCGIKSIIPFDEVVDAMDKVGDMMASELRETSLGGLAQTKTAINLSETIFK